MGTLPLTFVLAWLLFAVALAGLRGGWRRGHLDKTYLAVMASSALLSLLSSTWVGTESHDEYRMMAWPVFAAGLLHYTRPWISAGYAFCACTVTATATDVMAATLFSLEQGNPAVILGMGGAGWADALFIYPVIAAGYAQLASTARTFAADLGQSRKPKATG